MNLSKKRALLLGGLYLIPSIPFSLLNLETAGDIAFLIFIISLLMICFNKTPSYLIYIENQFPTMAYYITSNGWITYFLLLISMCYILGAQFITYSPAFISLFALILVGFCALAILTSLTVAFIKRKRLK